MPDIQYSGIDITPEMVKAASPDFEINMTGSLLDQNNITEMYDYVIAWNILLSSR